MRRTCQAVRSLIRPGSRFGAALALCVLGAAAANADSLSPSDTVLDTGTVSVTGSGTVTNVTPTVSYSVGDAFNGSALSNLPVSGGTWNFYDDYVFTVAAGSTVAGALVSFSNVSAGVSALQARIISTTTPFNAAANLGAPATGGVLEDSWATMNAADLYTVDLTSTLLTPGTTYDLQIRGDVASSGSGSYGGGISFTAVPLPTGTILLISGLGLFGATGVRRRAERV